MAQVQVKSRDRGERARAHGVGGGVRSHMTEQQTRNVARAAFCNNQPTLGASFVANTDDEFSIGNEGHKKAEGRKEEERSGLRRFDLERAVSTSLSQNQI